MIGCDRQKTCVEAHKWTSVTSYSALYLKEEYFPPHSVDAALCLSVTKWIQLNWGDDGLKRMFRQVYDSLAPGGVFIVEPQPWKSYRQAFRKQKMPEETRVHFRAITLKPQLYAEHLRRGGGYTPFNGQTHPSDSPSDSTNAVKTRKHRLLTSRQDDDET